LGFDNELTELEKAIAKRKKDLKELESMCADAQQAKDLVKASFHWIECFKKQTAAIIFYFCRVT